MFGFSRKKNPIALPAPDSQTLAAKMRADFARAVHGSYFSSLAFYTTPQLADKDDIEWLEAHDVKDQGWIVKKTRKMMTPGGEELERHELVSRGGRMDFFGAVEFISLYESHRLREAGALVGDDADKARAALGINHVRAFAEREGILFDRDNCPHATLSGVIVSDGFFEKGAAARAQDAFKRKQDIYAEMVGVRLPMPDLEGSREKKSVLNRLSRIIDDMELVAADLGRAMSEDVAWSYRASLSGKMPGQLESKYAAWFSASHNLLGKKDAYYERGERRDVNVDRLLLAFKYHALVTVAATIRSHIKGHCYCDDPCREQDAEEFADLARSALRSIGVDANDAEMISYTNIEKMVGNLNIKGGSLAILAEIVSHTRAMRDHVRDVLGISCNDTPMPDTKSFWQKLGSRSP